MKIKITISIYILIVMLSVIGYVLYSNYHSRLVRERQLIEEKMYELQKLTNIAINYNLTEFINEIKALNYKVEFSEKNNELILDKQTQDSVPYFFKVYIEDNRVMDLRLFEKEKI